MMRLCEASMQKNDGSSLLAHAEARLFINCATLSPANSASKSNDWSRRTVGKLWKPAWPGSITQARTRDTLPHVRGKPEVFDKARPVLEASATSCDISALPEKRLR